MPVSHIFIEPAFGPARAALMRSATGSGLVRELEQVATRTRITGVEAARTAPADAVPRLFGSYHAPANMFSVHALSLRDEGTAALTIAHEGVHRLRRFRILSGMLVDPFRSVPDAVLGAARGARDGTNPFRAAVRAVDRRSLHEEYVAFSAEARIASELGIPPDGVPKVPGLRADGSLRTEDELLDVLLEKRGYRRQVWMGRGMAVVIPGVTGAAAVQTVRRHVLDSGDSGS